MRQGVERLHLVFERHRDQVAADRALPRAPASRRAPPVERHHDEPVVRDPLVEQVALARLEDHLGERAAVDVDDHREADQAAVFELKRAEHDGAVAARGTRAAGVHG